MPVRIETIQPRVGGQYAGSPPFKMRFVHIDIGGEPSGLVIEIPNDFARSQHKLRTLGLEVMEYITGVPQDRSHD